MWLFSSSVGRKVIMSITGLFLLFFLLFHMSMNLVAIFSTEAYDMICEFLGANWYALVATLILAGGFVLHILYALLLTLQNRIARGKERYAVSSSYKEVDWSSRNMFALGVIVLGGVFLHLFNFWYKMQLQEVLHNPEAITHGSILIKDLFAQPVYVVLYLVWLFALWFHLTHGFWSALQSIGMNNGIWIKRVKCISSIFATIICLGFAVVVIYFFAISLCCGSCCA